MHIPQSLEDPDRPCNLVTGALGFVGRHLVRSLTLAGLPVVGIDRAGDPGPPPAKVGEFTLQAPDPAAPGGSISFAEHCKPCQTIKVGESFSLDVVELAK